MFRHDINALRALSVLAVLGYHVKLPGFAGGFAGVDIFFVITGYLMTSKVVNELTSNRFSFRDFIVMRFRRIYPALAAVVISCAIAGWFITLPGEYIRHLRQACYALSFLSNFAFDNDNGYFSLAAQTKPLLHTWSLSVEWQFYLLMPFFVWLFWHLEFKSKSKLNTVFCAIQFFATLSFAFLLYKNFNGSTSSSFFSLLARAWEPLVGGLIATLEIRQRLENSLRIALLETSAVAVTGWVLVAGCVIYPFAELQWPSSLTILPVLGGSIIIASRKRCWVDGILVAYPIQCVGNWSYSIYLWHWPILVFTLTWLSLRGHSVDNAQKSLIVLASIVFGAISYRYIEQPVRTRIDIWTPRRLISGYSVVFLLFLMFTAAAFLTTGFPNRLPEYLLPAELARRTNTPRDECFRSSNSSKMAKETYCRFGVDEADAKHSVILWGDSFANQYLEPISSAAASRGIHGLIATQSACRAFIDDSIMNLADQQNCREFNRSTMDFVLQHAEPSIVLLGSNWSNAEEISLLVQKLLSYDKTVILIMPLLNIGFDVPQKWFENQLQVGKAITEWKVDANYNLTNSKLRNEITGIVAKFAGVKRLIIVDPQSTICKQGQCYLVRDGHANFRDTAHISNINSEQFNSIFDAAFLSALQVKTSDNVEAK